MSFFGSIGFLGKMWLRFMQIFRVLLAQAEADEHEL